MEINPNKIYPNKIYYKDGYKYQLTFDCYIQINIFPKEDINTEFICLTTKGHLFIKKHYAWDGPSGPTINTKSFMRGSLIHDALYQLMREDFLTKDYRKQADKELRRTCIEDGMSKIRAWWVYKGVRGFANFAVNSNNKKEIIEAP